LEHSSNILPTWCWLLLFFYRLNNNNNRIKTSACNPHNVLVSIRNNFEIIKFHLQSKIQENMLFSKNDTKKELAMGRVCQKANSHKRWFPAVWVSFIESDMWPFFRRALNILCCQSIG
jgi:hypothetical protein